MMFGKDLITYKPVGTHRKMYVYYRFQVVEPLKIECPVGSFELSVGDFIDVPSHKAHSDSQAKMAICERYKISGKQIKYLSTVDSFKYSANIRTVSK